jgi:glutathione S-transferase
LKSLLNYLNEHLKTRSVLVGYQISVADLSVAADLFYVWQFLVDEKAK